MNIFCNLMPKSYVLQSKDKINALIFANVRLDLYLKIQKFVVKFVYQEKFCFLY